MVSDKYLFYEFISNRGVVGSELFHTLACPCTDGPAWLVSSTCVRVCVASCWEVLLIGDAPSSLGSVLGHSVADGP